MTDREYLLSLCGQLPDPEVKTVRYRRILAWSVGSRSSSADRTAWCQFLRDCFGRQYFSIVGAPRPSHSSCGSSSNSMERRTLLFPRPRFLMVCINLPPNWPTLNPCAAARSRNAPSSGCLTVLGKPLPYGRGSATVALISQGLPSRDRQGAGFVSQESPKWLSAPIKSSAARRIPDFRPANKPWPPSGRLRLIAISGASAQEAKKGAPNYPPERDRPRN